MPAICWSAEPGAPHAEASDMDGGYNGLEPPAPFDGWSDAAWATDDEREPDTDVIGPKLPKPRTRADWKKKQLPRCTL